jgi:protein-disulfide isomerase
MAGWRDAAVAGVLGAMVGAGAITLLERAGLDQDKAAIGRVVREYILTHPEVLPEAMHRLQAQQTAKLIAEHRAAIERPFGSAWAGNREGDVILVEFTDFACGYCRAALPDVTRLLAEDPKLKVVYREFPILSQASAATAAVALSASSPESYGIFRHSIYGAGPLTEESLRAAASVAKITPDAAKRAVIGQEIRNNLALGRELGLSGTPSFIVGDQILSGYVGFRALKDAVAAARGKQT